MVLVRFGKNVHSKQRKTISTQTLQFHVKFICSACPTGSASIAGITNLEAESYLLMQRAASLMHASEIKMLLNLPLIILVLTIKIFCNVKTLTDHADVIFKTGPQVVA